MTPFAYAPQTVTLPNQRISDAMRYGGVMLVWLGFTAVHPAVALEIYRNRRPDSPLRRRKSTRIPGEFAKTPAIQAF